MGRMRVRSGRGWAGGEAVAARVAGAAVLAAALVLAPASAASAAVKLTFDVDVSQVLIRDHNYVNFTDSFFDERLVPYSVSFRQTITIDDLVLETVDTTMPYREFTRRQIAEAFTFGPLSPELAALVAFTGDSFAFSDFMARVSDGINGGVASDFSDRSARLSYSKRYAYGYSDREVNVGEERQWTFNLAHQTQTLIDIFDKGAVGTPDGVLDGLVGAAGQFNFDLRARNIAYDYDYRVVDASGNPKQNYDRGTQRAYYGTATLVSVERTGAVPEPATWALMLAGFGVAGAALRRRGLRSRPAA